MWAMRVSQTGIEPAPSTGQAVMCIFEVFILSSFNTIISITCFFFVLFCFVFVFFFCYV